MPIMNHPLSADPIIGIDIGSTTVKTLLVDPSYKSHHLTQYQWYETRQAETVLQQRVAIGNPFNQIPPENIRCFITSSGAGPLTEPLGAKFVQEVSAIGVSDGVQSLITARYPHRPSSQRSRRWGTAL